MIKKFGIIYRMPNGESKQQFFENETDREKLLSFLLDFHLVKQFDLFEIDTKNFEWKW